MANPVPQMAAKVMPTGGRSRATILPLFGSSSTISELEPKNAYHKDNSTLRKANTWQVSLRDIQTCKFSMVAPAIKELQLGSQFAAGRSNLKHLHGGMSLGTCPTPTFQRMKLTLQ